MMKSNVSKTAPPLLLAVGVMLFVVAGAEAQVGLAVEARADVAFPTGDLSDSGIDSGLGFGAELQATFHPRITAYGGLYRQAFNCEGACILDANPRSQGFAAGLKFNIHSPGDAVLWARGGVLSSTLETDVGSSDRGTGFELGIGAEMPIGGVVHFVPQLRFATHDAGADFTASFIAIGVGVRYQLR